MIRGVQFGLLVTCLAIVVAAPAPTLANANTPDAPAPRAEPRDVDDLRVIQRRVQQVIEKNTDATVCLLIGGATGSGVIVDDQGTILTAGHVSGRPGRQVTVIFPNGKRAKAKTLGLNSRADAGMVRLTSKPPKDGWPTVAMADNNQLRERDWVVAMGHPGGYDPQRPMVARLGHVEAIGWQGVVSGCTLLAGDSGGPLFNLDGELVGIHSRIGLSRTQNMHVPIAVYRLGWDRFANGETWNQWVMPAVDPNKPFLGVAGRDHKRGAEVLSVLPDSAAEKAGIKINDIITAIDGKPVEDYAQLIDRVGDLKIGQKVRIVVVRDGRPKTIKAVIQRRGGDEKKGGEDE